MENYSIIIDKSACHPEIEQYYQIQRYLENYQYLKTYLCNGLEEIKRAAMYAALESDFLVVMGKTRAFHEVVAGLFRANASANIPIFFLPSGNFNDLAWNFGALGEIDKYFKEAFTNTPLNLDIFSFNQSFFSTYTINSPFLPEVLKKDKKTFAKEISKRILRNNSKNYNLDIMVDGKKINGEYNSFLLGNTQALLGKTIFNYPSLTDGKCELLLMKKMSTLKLVNEFLAFFSGECRLDELSCTEKYTGLEIRITSKKPFANPFLIDGAYEQANTTNIEVKPLARVRVLRGNTKI